MAGTARVLSSMVRRTSASLVDVSRYSEGYGKELAEFIRRILWGGRAVDETNASLLRSYQLRNTVHDGGFRRTPIGVVIGDADFARFYKGSHISRISRVRFLGTRAADSSYLGYFRIAVPKGVDAADFVRRWQSGKRHDVPQAEWTPSPFGPAALEGRPPVRIAMHHGKDGFVTEIMRKPLRAPFGRTLPDRAYRTRFLDADDLVGLLRQDRYLRFALKAHPDSAIWLSGCRTSDHEAQVIADAFNRTTHFSTGITETFNSRLLIVAVPGNPVVPFSVTDEVLRDFDSSLVSAPPGLRNVGEKLEWSATAIYVEADSLVPPIQTVTPK
jgi:hypothetical protein